MSYKWKGTCPICGKAFSTGLTEFEMLNHIGATMDCPSCNALLKLNEDLTCSDFGEELVSIYHDMGLDVSKAHAQNSYIDL